MATYSQLPPTSHIFLWLTSTQIAQEENSGQYSFSLDKMCILVAYGL